MFPILQLRFAPDSKDCEARHSADGTVQAGRVCREHFAGHGERVGYSKGNHTHLYGEAGRRVSHHEGSV